MSTSKDLYCPQTGEAVPLFRLGNGNYTPAGDYSNQVLFHFLSYHEQLNVECTFEVRSVEKGIEDRQPVHSLEDLKYLKEVDESISTVLVWDYSNYQELGSRIKGVVDTLAEYDFGHVNLKKWSNKMKRLIALLIGLSVGFGSGYLVFYKEVEQPITLTLNDVDKVPAEQIQKILTNKGCEKISHQTIQCKI